MVRVPFGAISVIFAVTGCGRIGFDTGTSIDDARTDGPTDAAPSFGPWKTPFQVNAMETSSMDFGPTFSFDTNEVYVAQRFTGDADIYRYTRPDAQSEYGNRQAMTALNISGGEEGEPSLSDDGTALYFNRYNPDQIFVSTRSDVQSTNWSTPVPLEQLHPNLAGFHSPELSTDQRMVLEKDGSIWEARRASILPWPAPVSLGITGFVPCLRSDGLELLWEGAVTIGGASSVAIFRATRPTLDDPFGAPERLSFGALDVAGVGDPELSHDGRLLIFSAEEVPGRGTYDIYISERDIE